MTRKSLLMTSASAHAMILSAQLWLSPKADAGPDEIVVTAAERA